MTDARIWHDISSYTNSFHYCKLLSPARIMEWMYVDGLRRRDRASQNPTVFADEEEDEGVGQLLRGKAALAADVAEKQ